MCELLERHPEADLALFPELFLTGYQLTDLAPLARQAARALDSVRATARRTATAVVAGTAWPLAEGVANSAMCISPAGEVVDRYDKAMLFGAERAAFKSGRRLLTFEVAGVRVAPLICFDLEFPEPARILARAGADLLAVISANMRPYHREHRLFCAARALENRLPVAYVNRVGRESGFVFTGGTRLVGQDGRTLKEAGGRAEHVAVLELPAGPVAEADVDYLRWARSDLGVGV